MKSRITWTTVALLITLTGCSSETSRRGKVDRPPVGQVGRQDEMAVPLHGEIEPELPGPSEVVKLRGVVVNAKTRKPLSSANVVATRESDGSIWGCTTLADGSFQLELPKARYSVEVLYLGYAPRAAEVDLEADELPALEVALDQTTVRTFDVFEVTGRSIMVDVKDMAFVQEVGSEDLTGYAVDTVEEAVGRHSGIVARKGELHVRGGRSGEISFRINPVPVPDPLADPDKQPLPPSASVQAKERARAARNLQTPWFKAIDSSTEIWVITRSPVGHQAEEEGPGTGSMLCIDPNSQERVPALLKHTSVKATVDGYIAGVDVEQQFENPFSVAVDAEYVFPLPTDAAVQDFLMIVGERRIRGIIREREEAARIYQAARRQGHAAALLSQERPNVFTQKVANIAPGKRVDIRLHYFNTLDYKDGWYEFVFPMVVGPRFNPPGTTDGIAAVAHGDTRPTGQATTVHYLRPDQRSGHDIDLSVDLRPGVELEELKSRSHVVRLSGLEGGGRRVELSQADRVPNKDFVLRYRVAGNRIKTNLLTHRDGNQRYFTMMLFPPASIEDTKRGPVEFVFVLDCSGSMSGAPMALSKSAMRRALKHLNADDSFQIVRFSEAASQLGPAPVLATPENIEMGLNYVAGLHGGGGTHMLKGIEAALNFPHDPRRLRVVTFLTDGYIGNEREIFAAIHRDLGAARIFSFGVGSSPNRFLLEGMARLGNGAVAMVSGESDAEVVDLFYQRLQHPAMTDLQIVWGKMEVKDVYPSRLPDLFVGRPILVTGRFEGQLPERVRVKGMQAGKPISVDVPTDSIADGNRPALAAVWARRNIASKMDVLNTEPVPGLAEQVRDLALQYNLVSSYTSFVAVDAAVTVTDGESPVVPVPVNMPEGVLFETTVRQ